MARRVGRPQRINMQKQTGFTYPLHLLIVATWRLGGSGLWVISKPQENIRRLAAGAVHRLARGIFGIAIAYRVRKRVCDSHRMQGILERREAIGLPAHRISGNPCRREICPPIDDHAHQRLQEQLVCQELRFAKGSAAPSKL